MIDMLLMRRCEGCACFNANKKWCEALNEHRGRSAEACYGYIPKDVKEG